MPERLTGKILAPVGNHVESARPDKRAQDQPRSEIDNRVGANSLARRAAAGGPKSGEESKGNKDAIPVNAEAAELKGNLVHVTGTLGTANRKFKCQTLIPAPACAVRSVELQLRAIAMRP